MHITTLSTHPFISLTNQPYNTSHHCFPFHTFTGIGEQPQPPGKARPSQGGVGGTSFSRGRRIVL